MPISSHINQMIINTAFDEGTFNRLTEFGSIANNGYAAHALDAHLYLPHHDANRDRTTFVAYELVNQQIAWYFEQQAC